MFDLTGVLREFTELAAFTGLSAGALAGLVALVWFFPPARTLAIQLAVVVITGYVAGLYWYHAGRADVTAQWDRANAAAAKMAELQDEATSARVKAEFLPQMTALQKQADQYKQQVDKYERTIGVNSAPATCQLGAAALRLRQQRH